MLWCSWGLRVHLRSHATLHGLARHVAAGTDTIMMCGGVCLHLSGAPAIEKAVMVSYILHACLHARLARRFPSLAPSLNSARGTPCRGAPSPSDFRLPPGAVTRSTFNPRPRSGLACVGNGAGAVGGLRPSSVSRGVLEACGRGLQMSRARTEWGGCQDEIVEGLND